MWIIYGLPRIGMRTREQSTRSSETAFREAELPNADVEKMRHSRHHLGNGIGNLRLVEFSINRADGDAPITRKMAFTKDDAEPIEVERDAEDFALDLRSRERWRQASGERLSWSSESLAAFQEAVEQRAIWPYKRPL